MSAFICGDATFKVLALYHTSQPSLDLRAATGTARLLYAENLESVLYRYKTDKRENYAKPEELDAVTFADNGKLARYLRDPIAMIKIAQCYAYQSCEHDGWATSRARQIADDVVARALRKLPGYDEAPWGL